MTKEELRQKAEAEADKVIIGSGMDRASVNHLKHLLVTMYMQGATEATKEFESCLEDTIKGKNPFPNICWKLICGANDKLIKQKTELEKENTALRQDWEVMKSTIIDCEDICDKYSKLEKENESLENIKTIYITDLVKAKKLLKRWANSYGSIDVALCKQTDCFLSEVEK